MHKAALIILAVLGLGILLLAMTQKLSPENTGAASEVKLYFQPSATTMPPSRKVILVMDSGTKNVVFAKVKIEFDPKLVVLGAETDTSTLLPGVIQKTTKADGSTTGTATFTVVAQPGGTLPKGVNQLATLTFSKSNLATAANLSALVRIVPNETEIVSSENEDFSTNLSDMTFTLNPGASTVPTPTPTVKPTPAPVISTFNPVDDTSVVASAPTSVEYGTRQTLYINGGPVIISYMKFDLSSLNGRTITNAKLKFRVDTGSSGSSSTGTQQVKEVAATNWSETTLNYNSRPALGNTIATLNGGALGEWKEVDVTSYIKSFAGKIVSLGLDSQSGDGFVIYSKEATDKPQLVITN